MKYVIPILFTLMICCTDENRKTVGSVEACDGIVYTVKSSSYSTYFSVKPMLINDLSDIDTTRYGITTYYFKSDTNKIVNVSIFHKDSTWSEPIIKGELLTGDIITPVKE